MAYNWVFFLYYTVNLVNVVIPRGNEGTLGFNPLFYLDLADIASSHVSNVEVKVKVKVEAGFFSFRHNKGHEIEISW